MSRTLIFVGPTITASQIHTIAPAVEIFPPVAAGDLLKLDLTAGDLVAIIDGYYFQSASVRHKEILSLLDRGIHVWGAASMGALRAAELALFGMRGFGYVFEAYRQGIIEGDDEVAVLHGPGEMNYMSVTEALVNVRYACQCAVDENILSSDMYYTIIDVAAALPFFERNYQLIFKKAQEKGLRTEETEALSRYVRQERLDIKKADALEMLHTLQTFKRKPPPLLRNWNETTFLRTWKGYWQGISMDEDHWISDYDILTAYKLFGEDYPRFHFQTLLRTLAEIAARYLDTAALEKSNRDSREESIVDENIHRDMLSERSSMELIASYLRQKYGFPRGKDLPACMHRWLRPQERTFSPDEKLTRIAIRLWHVRQSFEWADVIIAALKTSNIYWTLVKLVYRAQLFNENIQSQHPEFDLNLLAKARIVEWFMEKWGAMNSDMEIEVRDRGFINLERFIRSARPYYLFDKHSHWSQAKGKTC